jgi:hypothetical protein
MVLAVLIFSEGFDVTIFKKMGVLDVLQPDGDIKEVKILYRLFLDVNCYLLHGKI